MQFYRGIWNCRSHISSPLIALVQVSEKKSKWTKVLQQTIEDIKKVTESENILTYPNFNEIFEIHKDISDQQLVVFISHRKKSGIFFCMKLSRVQRNCTTTERVMSYLRDLALRLCTTNDLKCGSRCSIQTLQTR